MAGDLEKQGDEESGGAIEERRRVLRHASCLNRADVIKKVVLLQPSSRNSQPTSSGAGAAAAPPLSGQGVVDADVDREVLDHVDEEGLTALHHAVVKSSLDVSVSVTDDSKMSFALDERSVLVLLSPPRSTQACCD